MSSMDLWVRADRRAGAKEFLTDDFSLVQFNIMAKSYSYSAQVCHVCGLSINSKKSLTQDHYPIAKSRNGDRTVPCHKWCNEAHGNRRDAKNPKYLERHITMWQKNDTRFNWRAYKSLYKLQRDFFAKWRKIKDIKRSVNFLLAVPEKHQGQEWVEQLSFFITLMTPLWNDSINIAMFKRIQGLMLASRKEHKTASL